MAAICGFKEVTRDFDLRKALGSIELISAGTAQGGGRGREWQRPSLPYVVVELFVAVNRQTMFNYEDNIPP